MRFVDLFINDRKLMLPELYIVVVVSAIRAYGAFITTHSIQPNVGIGIGYIVAFSCIVAINLVVNNIYFRDTLNSYTLLNGVFMSSFSVDVVKLVLLFSTICVLLSTVGVYNRDGRSSYEYPLLVLLTTLGLMFMVNANDILTFYLALEWQSRCLYVLAAFNRGSGYSVEAGMKYFVLGSIASRFILLGITIVYGMLGIVNITDISTYRYLSLSYSLQQEIINNTLINIGWLLIISGMLFKLAAVPFHIWVADVYDGSPMSSTIYFAVVPKIALVYMLVVFAHGPFNSLIYLSGDYLYLSGILSIVLGTLGARGQSRIKRFIAYSSISNIGFILLGLSLFTLDGDQAAMIYIILYTLISIVVWSVIASVIVTYVDSVSLELKHMVYLSDLTGLSNKNPMLATIMSVVMLSIGGIPPLAGFVSKLFIITSMVVNGIYVSTVVVMFISCISAFYYLRVIKIMFFEPYVDNNVITIIDIPRSLLLGVLFITIFVILLSPNTMMVVIYSMIISLM